jgi:hypothetical protein
MVAAMVAILLLQIVSSAQDSKPAPPVAPGEKADILFAASAPGSEKDEEGKPALATLDPIAFVVKGELRGCYKPNPTANDNNIPKTTLDNLSQAYKSGHSYPVWSRGAPWGRSESVKSCIDPDLSLTGCVKLEPSDPKTRVSPNFIGAAITFPQPVPTHPATRAHASAEERKLFLQLAASVYAERHIRIAPTSIHAETVWKTQLQSSHSALAGNTLVQYQLRDANKWASLRIFLVLEESNGQYAPVLAHFNKIIITPDENTAAPKTGEILDEGDDTDRETFLDNFPLFSNESDSIISYHQYYEDWAYSIYRRRGKTYQMVYSGCGGGA